MPLLVRSSFTSGVPTGLVPMVRRFVVRTARQPCFAPTGLVPVDAGFGGMNRLSTGTSPVGTPDMAADPRKTGINAQ
jgi:hypothetical protein